MFEINEDVKLIRKESVRAYFLTLVILVMFQFYWVAVFYALSGTTLVFFDDEVSELHENDVYIEEFERFIDLHSIDQRQSITLIRNEILQLSELVSNNIESISNEFLPLERKIRLNKNKIDLLLAQDRLSMEVRNLNPYLILKKNKNDRFKFLLEIREDYVNTSFSRKTLPRRLTLEDAYAEVENQSQLNVPRAKKIIFVVNDYLYNTFIARGVYPSSDLDFFYFYYNSKNTVFF